MTLDQYTLKKSTIRMNIIKTRRALIQERNPSKELVLRNSLRHLEQELTHHVVNFYELTKPADYL